MDSELIEQLRTCAKGCDLYSPDQCATLIDGIGHVAMRHLLTKAADRLAGLAAGGEAVAWERRLLHIKDGSTHIDWTRCTFEEYDANKEGREGLAYRTEYRALYPHSTPAAEQASPKAGVEFTVLQMGAPHHGGVQFVGRVADPFSQPWLPTPGNTFIAAQQEGE